MTDFQPKAYRLLVVTLLLLLSACSSKPVLESNAKAPTVPLPENIEQINAHANIVDPFEGFNRRMYYFNAKADKYVMIPAVRGYKAITPDFVEHGVSNFFDNLGEIATFANALLQFKGGVALETLGRFTVNSTLGLAGLFDVATPIGLQQQNEDFGQTLGYWGISSGPYLVLPILGPSTVRDTLASGVDMVIFNAAVNELGLKNEEELVLSTLRAIDTRARLPFRYYSTGSAFEYEKVRLLYLKYRELLITR